MGKGDEPKVGVEYKDITLNDEFDEWLERVVTDKNKHENLLKTLTHYRDNELVAELKIDHDNFEYVISIKGESDEDGISFDFYRREGGQWRFGIDIDDVEIKGGLELKKLVYNEENDGFLLQNTGYARFLMVIMIYCLEKYIDKPIDLNLAGDNLTIGICADSSDGFWEYMGMKVDKYSMDGERRGSRVGPNCAYDRSFLMRDWKRWLFSHIKKRARSKRAKKKETKKKKKKKSKKKKKLTKMR